MHCLVDPKLKNGIVAMTAVELPEDTLVFAEESRAFLEPYMPPKNASGAASDMAWATLTFATSLDSQLALAPGTRTVLSGPDSKAMTHYLRSRHDAIMIGVGAAVADDPGLNCRLKGVGGYGGVGVERQPQPIIIDPTARWKFSETSKIFRMLREGRGHAPFIITSVATPPPENTALLERYGGKYITVPLTSSEAGEDQMDWGSILAVLKKEGLQSVMVEGGGVVINSLLEPRSQELIRSVIVTVAPTWLGQGGVVVSPPRRFEGAQAIPASRLTSVCWQPLGEDVVLCGKIKP
jgi:2,5-diamino-6-(ribosylamino)-4(3H)-pyrimidinone 5'-phosphate reductase